ncbi:MAG: PAS domain-containing protein, partial [Chloroflexota bacterium]|nr:PAS domain-containing protein [Chloroflexota bacterium]
MAIYEVPLHPTTDAVLAGGGEMGALMRALDWSAMPLGPVGDWPQSLRTSVSICLASRFPMLIWWGPELVMLYNDAYRPILGATKHPAAMGQRGRECWPEIWDVIGPMLTGVLARGDATWSEDQLLLLNRNGYVEECYFTFSYSPIRDESGGIGGIFTAVTETTERVLGERRLRTLRALASAVEARTTEDACHRAMDALAENSADIPFALLYLLDTDGSVARLADSVHLAPDTPASPAVIRLDDGQGDTGWPFARVVATAEAARLDDIPRRFGALPSGLWGTPPTTALILPIPARAQEWPAGLLVVGISPRRILDEAYAAFYGLVAGQIATAIGDARAYEEERRRTEALAALDRAKTAFFSNVSHEFRTPLTLMLGPVADALDDTEGALTPTQRERLEVAHRNGLRLQRLVNNVLDFSRIEAGRVEASYEPTDLAVFTQELAGLFRSAIERAELRLVVDCPPLPAPVLVDREMWEKIVLNLLSNALKFTFDGEIVVRLRADGGRAVLTVADTGTGIPPEELPHLFERFHRVRGARARTFEGSGIGLPLVQELARLHGGEIATSSTVGEGTTFTVTIPTATGTVHQLADERADVSDGVSTTATAASYVEEALRWLPNRAESDQVGGGNIGAESPLGNVGGGVSVGILAGARILLADDNADMRAYARRLLQGDYAVETVADGEAALAAARERPPDLILTDVMMPRLDGFALLRALRADPRTQDIPVIFLSARAGEESAIEGLAAGADGYLVKPFSARELQARVAAALAMARLRRETVRERERIYATLLQAPVGIAVFRGPQQIVEFANPRVCELWGRTLEQVFGRPLFEALPEVAGQGLEALLDGVFATGTPFVGSELPVSLNRAGRRDVVYFNFVYAPVREPSGEIRGVIVVATDVTEQVQLRERAEEERQQFVAMVAHELRNPITSLMGYAQLMKRRERYDA